MEFVLKLPHEQHQNIRRYSAHKRDYLGWFVDVYRKNGLDKTTLTLATQKSLAINGGFIVRACDLVPMAQVIRCAKLLEPLDIAKIGDEMIDSMQKANAWYAENVSESDTDRWVDHERHKHYTGQLQRARDIIQRPETPDLAKASITPFDQEPTNETLTLDVSNSINQPSLQLELKLEMRSSNVVSSIFQPQDASKESAKPRKDIRNDCKPLSSTFVGNSITEDPLTTKRGIMTHESSSPRADERITLLDNATSERTSLRMSNVTLIDITAKGRAAPLDRQKYAARVEDAPEDEEKGEVLPLELEGDLLVRRDIVLESEISIEDFMVLQSRSHFERHVLDIERLDSPVIRVYRHEVRY